ncbi:MAG: metal ABC transporter substrate-binding protein [Dehalococcoidia bacterium]
MPMIPRPAIAAALTAVLTVALLLGACGSADVRDGEGDGISVVATFPLIGELATRIAGADVAVATLIPLGVDEHAYQPSTTVARTVAGADLALVNGYHLEEGLLSIIVENVRDGVPVVAVSRGLEALEGGHDDEEHEGEDEEAVPAGKGLVDDAAFAEGDPHFWLSVRNAIGYAENIRDALVALDPGGADGYRERATELIAELEALDSEIRETLSVIPAERRKIVVFHDAYEYFAQAYDFEVIASVAPSNPNQAASAAAIAAIVDTVRAEGVTTIYREPQYSAQALDVIAEESGAKVAVLYSIPTDDVPSYAAMMRANARALVEGLGR